MPIDEQAPENVQQGISRIDEIVESLDKVVEYTGEQIHIDLMPHAEYQKFLWTCLRDLARYVQTLQLIEDNTSTPGISPQDFDGDEDTIDKIIQDALGPHSLGQAQLDAMRRLAKEIILLRARCICVGMDINEVKRHIREMISYSESAERDDRSGQWRRVGGEEEKT